MSTKIEWCHETWNPITGCSAISEGCKNCYARRMARRLAGRYGYPEAPNHFNITFHSDRLSLPLKWKKPRKIFVCSMGDLFHDDVQLLWLRQIFFQIYTKRQHKYLILTKRPKKMALDFERLQQFQYNPYDFNHVWLGVTVEHPDYLWRIDELLKIPAAVHFVSLEPLLSNVFLNPYLYTRFDTGDGRYGTEKLNWIITGPETGPGKRECKPEWIRDLYEQCQAVGVPFFDKTKTDWIAREFPNL